MSAKRKRYSKQFKLEAIALYEDSERSMTSIEQELGITAGLLGKWREELLGSRTAEAAFPGNGRLPDDAARMRQLERENARLRQEKEILKKVLGMYSKDGR
jgi:transposase